MSEKLCSTKKIGGAGGILKKVVIGSSNSETARSFNVASILPDKYKELTLDNFAISDVGLSHNGNFNNWQNSGLLGAYDPASGILTTKLLANWYTSYSSAQKWFLTFTIVCYYVE